MSIVVGRFQCLSQALIHANLATIYVSDLDAYFCLAV